MRAITERLCLYGLVTVAAFMHARRRGTVISARRILAADNLFAQVSWLAVEVYARR